MTTTSRTRLPARLTTLSAEACLDLRRGENKSAASWLPPQLRQLQIQILPERDRGGRGTFSLDVPSLFNAN
jgi:hypothetical protein